MTQGDRRLVFFTSAGYCCLWFDLSLGHVSAGLKHPAMWVPVLFLPVAAIVTVCTAVHHPVWLQRVFSLTCFGAILVGILGFGFHALRFWHDLHGSIQAAVLMRLLRYPPLLAPLAISGVGVLGLLIREMPGATRR